MFLGSGTFPPPLEHQGSTFKLTLRFCPNITCCPPGPRQSSSDHHQTELTTIPWDFSKAGALEGDGHARTSGPRCFSRLCHHPQSQALPLDEDQLCFLKDHDKPSFKWGVFPSLLKMLSFLVLFCSCPQSRDLSSRMPGRLRSQL